MRAGIAPCISYSLELFSSGGRAAIDRNHWPS